MRTSFWSIPVILLTGIGLVYSSDGAYARTIWLRGSIVMFIAMGLLLGLLRVALRRASESGGAATPFSLRRVRMLAAGLCVLVAGIVVLMVAKPG